MEENPPHRPAYDRTLEDIGNIVEFGHVNTRVPDPSLATLFYVSGLGLTRDPYLMTGTDNMWINVGLAQFHLPTGAPQVTRGTVGLVLPDLHALRRRLDRVAPLLAGTAFAWTERDSALEVTCPWGNRIRCHAPAASFGPMVLGMPYVAFDAPPGSAATIARFYRDVLGAAAHVGHDRTGTFASIAAGPLARLIYRESEAPLGPFDGHHIQISLADFSLPYRKLLARGLISEESDQHQYRFQALVDPDSGESVLELEHEVRSMRHPLFARPLINRDATISNRDYATGRETQAWSAPAATSR
jgi:catechol 2,3-dioxygenase-like lactoylglutathione lyase family enzyme